MFFICMGSNKKGVFPLRPAHGCFVAYPVCLLRGNFPGRKGLADLIAEHIRLPLLFPACDRFILCPGEQELGIGGLVVALIGRNELAVLGFIRVFPVVQTILQRAGDGFPLADMVGNESGGCRKYPSSPQPTFATSGHFVPKSRKPGSGIRHSPERLELHHGGGLHDLHMVKPLVVLHPV